MSRPTSALVLALRETEQRIHTRIDLQFAVFESAGRFHVPQAHLAGNAHVLFFECGEFYAIECPALLTHHVIDADGCTLVVHLRNAAGIVQQRVKPFVLVANRLLQLFKFCLTLVEHRRILHEDRSRLLRSIRLCNRFGFCCRC